MRRRWWTLLLLLLGCESASEVIAEQRPAVERTFSAISALAPRVASQPLEAPRPAPLVLEGASANATFVYEEELAHPGAEQPVTLRTLDARLLLQCGALLTRGQYFQDSFSKPRPSVVRGLLEACAGLRYVLVIRQREFTEPALSLTTRSFSRGRYAAEVLAFELPGGAYLGGFEVKATNDERVSLLDEDLDHRPRLLSNLQSGIFEALREGARRAFPGSLPAK